MDNTRGTENSRINELVMYFPPDFQIIFAPVAKAYVMEYVDNFQLHRLEKFCQELNDKINLGIYESI